MRLHSRTRAGAAATYMFVDMRALQGCACAYVRAHVGHSLGAAGGRCLGTGAGGLAWCFVHPVLSPTPSFVAHIYTHLPDDGLEPSCPPPPPPPPPPRPVPPWPPLGSLSQLLTTLVPIFQRLGPLLNTVVNMLSELTAFALPFIVITFGFATSFSIVFDGWDLDG